MADVYANAGIEAALIAGESGELDEAAEKLLHLAQGHAAGHGNYAASFKAARDEGERGVVDRIVYTDHPHAQAIERGHVIRNSPDGDDLGYVQGINALTKAIESMPEVRE